MKKTKNLLLFASILFSLVLFHRPLEILLTKTIVAYALSYIEKSRVNDIIFLIIALTITGIIIQKFRNKYIPSMVLLSILFTASVAYFYYRFWGDVWKFTPFYYYEKFNYFDVFVFGSFLSLILIIRQKKRKIIKSNDGFIDDMPAKLEDDRLGYKKYAESLANKIRCSNFDESFAIGINGKWGSGKTSFIDFIKSNIGENEAIKIDFKPWKYETTDSLIRGFFETFQESLSPYHSSISKLLNSYSNKLVDLHSNSITESIQAAIVTLTGAETLNNLFEKIKAAIFNIDKKIIVYIDDLDRLDKEEILEVLKLIRNTANFPNTFFVVAYDRNYLVNALENYNSHKKERFLEKIFQLEVTLPYFKKGVLRKRLYDILKNRFPSDFKHNKNEKTSLSILPIPEILEDWLDNMRDVTRLTNSLIINYSLLQGEVDFNDFLKLEALRMKYPSVYVLLFKRPKDFLESKGNGDEKHQYHLKVIDSSEKEKIRTEPTKYKNCKWVLELYLYENHNGLSVPLKDIEKIISLVSKIFGDGKTYNIAHDSKVSVVYPSKFNRYFAYRLLEGSLSEVEFSKARNLSQIEFDKKIEEWVKNNLSGELAEQFSNINSFDNREDFEKIIRAIFHFSRQRLEKYNNEYQYYILPYNDKYLYNKLSNHEDRLTRRFYSNNEELKEFVLDLFNRAPSPYLFESGFANYCGKHFYNKEGTSEFPLNKFELKNLVIAYFQTYCNEVEKIDKNLKSLYHNCLQTNNIDKGNGQMEVQRVFPNEAKEIIRDFAISKDLDGFLLYVIGLDSDFVKSKITNIAIEVFGDWSNFQKIIEEQEEKRWKYLKEFKTFFKSCEAVGFTNYIEFEFKDIPIEKKKPKEGF